MTKRPRLELKPGHKHQWQPTLGGSLAYCRICDLAMPINIVHLDQPLQRTTVPTYCPNDTHQWVADYSSDLPVLRCLNCPATSADQPPKDKP